MNRSLALGALVAVSFAGPGKPALAQGVEGELYPRDALEWSTFRLANLRPSGQPVIPFFEGWFQNPDGSYTLSFGYLNLNTEEVVEIPLGPDNFIEPGEFDGVQPAYFGRPYPAPGRDVRSSAVHTVFTVTLPQDFGDQRVVWTLRHRGKVYSVPGHTAAPSYQMEDLWATTSAPVALPISFEPAGPEGKGRIGLTSEPGFLAATAGTPVPLSVWVGAAASVSFEIDLSDVEADASVGAQLDSNFDDERGRLWWFKHQGPGDVRFGQGNIPLPPDGGELATTVTFSEPGEYVLRLQLVESASALVQGCCWTNGYVKATVSP